MLTFKTIGAVSAVAVLSACGSSEPEPEMDGTEQLREFMAAAGEINEARRAEAEAARPKTIWDTTPDISRKDLRLIYYAQTQDNFRDNEFIKYAACMDERYDYSEKAYRDAAANEFGFADYLNKKTAEIRGKINSLADAKLNDAATHYTFKDTTRISLSDYNFNAQSFGMKAFEDNRIRINDSGFDGKADQRCGGSDRRGGPSAVVTRPRGWPSVFLLDIQNASAFQTFKLPPDQAEKLVERMNLRGNRDRRAILEVIFELPRDQMDVGRHERFAVSDSAIVPITIIKARLLNDDTKSLIAEYTADQLGLD